MESASSWSWVTKSAVMPDASLEPPDLVAHLHAQLASRFDSGSSKSRSRLERQHPRQRHPLLLAARQLAR